MNAQITTTLPQLVTITSLPKLPPETMTMYSSQPEAERAAAERNQPFIWYYPQNYTYYVAVTK